MTIFATVSREIENYLTKQVDIREGVSYSEYRLKRRIGLFENKIYPNGRIDNQKKYKYWFDIITPRRDAEVKNIDFDTRDIRAETGKGWEVCDMAVNLTLSDWLKKNGQAAELNAAIEEFSSWGNVLFKKTKEGYKRCDQVNTFIINQTAECVDETPIIERFVLTQSELREKEGEWNDVQKVIDELKNKFFNRTIRSVEDEATFPYYEIFERNGTTSVHELKEAQGKKPKEGDDKKYVLAKIILAGLDKGQGTTGIVLFAEEYPVNKELSDYFVEAHRGPYKGSWMREGIYELLFDCQVRANEIGNQLARGLEYASKKIFASKDRAAYQNVLTSVRNGDILKGEFASLDTRMDGFDQLIADWNRNIQMANEIANSREVVQGESLPSGTPFRMGALLNQNANKLFDFLREKLAIPFNIISERWIVPLLVKELKADGYAKVLNNSAYYDKFIDLLIDNWYLDNLLAFGPHGKEFADFIKQEQKQKVLANKNMLATFTDEFWKGYKAKVRVDITGESSTMQADLQTAGTFVPLIADPMTRDDLVKQMMKKSIKWLDVDSLAKTQAQPQPTPQPGQPQMRPGMPQETPQPMMAK